MDRIHLYNRSDILAPRGPLQKESVSLELGRRMLDVYQDWSDPKFSDSFKPNELDALRDHVIDRAKAELERAIWWFKEQVLILNQIKQAVPAATYKRTWHGKTAEELEVELSQVSKKDLNDRVIRPKVIITSDGKLLVSAEDGGDWADYYGECRGGYPWIHPKLEEFAKEHKLYWEWENPGAISLWEL